jgi:hypothetical protein
VIKPPRTALSHLLHPSRIGVRQFHGASVAMKKAQSDEVENVGAC